MLKWIESTGKSEEAAIEAALQKLGMDRDEVSVEILERAKSGFLGIGSCPAKVKVSYEAPDEPEERPTPAEVTPAEAELVKAAEPAVREEAPSPAAPVAEGEKAERIDAFLTGLLAQMGAEARPVIRMDENGTYQVELVGRELGGLIDVYVEGRAYTGAATFEALVAAAPPAMRTYFSTTRTVVADQVRWLETETRPVEKLTMLFTNEALRDTAFRVYQDSGRFEVTSSIPNNLELNGKGVDKGKALLTLAGLLGLDRSQVMACGDSINDLAMLRAAGLGVAMGNAAPEIAAAADVRTACNDEDGVAKAIEWYVLGQKGED